MGKTIQAQCSAVSLEWIPLRYHKWPPILSTIYDLARLRSIVRRRQGVQPADIVHCRSYLTSLVGLWMKRRFNTKFVFDMRGFWADERIEGNIWSMGNPVYRRVYQYFKRKEREFLQHADAVVTLTENAKQELLAWGFANKLVWVIPTCVDMKLFDPLAVREEEKLALRKTLGLEPTDFVVTYVGSWGTWYLTDQMLKFFESMQAKEPRSRFLIITTDSVVTNNERIKVVSATRKEVPGLLNVSDMAIMFIKPTYSKKASSATKLGELLAMGIPVCEVQSAGERILQAVLVT
jgi:glycosyltransferase involved in cell wall biosynthesis